MNKKRTENRGFLTLSYWYRSRHGNPEEAYLQAWFEDWRQSILQFTWLPADFLGWISRCELHLGPPSADGFVDVDLWGPDFDNSGFIGGFFFGMCKAYVATRRDFELFLANRKENA